MEKRKKSKIYILIFLIVLIAVIVFCINKFKSKDKENVQSTAKSEITVIKTDIINTVSNSTYITTALEENKELHATYYFDEIYFEKNQYISAGENILKYTNGKYLVAPYNCVLTDFSLPDSNEMCTNKHYITIQSTDSLKMSLEIDESELDTIHVGQEARIEVDTLQDKTITGYVTNINNTATYSSSGSTFGVDVEFKNDGDILLGMSADCSIILEKAEDVIAVAKEAITDQNGQKSVEVKLSDGTTKTVNVETGISNDAYTEIKSGLDEGEIVIINEEAQSTQNKIMQKQNRQGEFSQNFDKEFGGTRSGGEFQKNSGSSTSTGTSQK